MQSTEMSVLRGIIHQTLYLSFIISSFLKMRKISINFLIGFLGGIVSILLISNLPSVPILGNIFGSILRPERIIERVEKEVKIIPQEEAITEKVDKISRSIVLIQSFRGGQLLRFGSGAMLTNDGVIVTTNNVVPIDADVFQVFINDKISKAKLIKRDTRNNLALLKISEEMNQSPIVFSSSESKIGDINYIIGKYIEISTPAVFVQQAIISRKVKDIIYLDTKYSNDLSGSLTVNKNTEVNGIIFVDGSRVLAVESRIVKEFFESYSAKINENGGK